jgi:MFS family permease
MQKYQKLTKNQFQIIKIATIGGILEWYEIYSFIYLAPILAKLFFKFNSDINNILNVYLLFGIGFLAKPFGAVFFGRIGDLMGRKTAFISSIIMMTIPTFLMGCLPTYASIGIFAPILFYLLRVIQSIASASEIPGTICFLYENSSKDNIHFMCSWAYVGNQIGGIIALIETILLECYFLEENILKWGWRILFWTGALLGLFGIYLRSSLLETPVFNSLKNTHNIDDESILQIIKHNKLIILMGIAFGAINASTFYLIATYIPQYIKIFEKLDPISSTIYMIITLIVMTLFLPIFGKYIDKSGSKSIFIQSCILIIGLLPFLHWSFTNKSSFFLFIALILFIIPVTMISAIYPYWIARVFHPKIRYTSIGLAFNFTDAVFGSFGPAIALLLFKFTNDSASFCWYIFICAILSIFSYLKLRKSEIKNS